MYYGFDMGGTKIEFGAFDVQRNRLMQKRVPTPRDDYEALLEVFTRLTQEADAELGVMGKWASAFPVCLTRRAAHCLLPTFPQPWESRWRRT